MNVHLKDNMIKKGGKHLSLESDGLRQFEVEAPHYVKVTREKTTFLPRFSIKDNNILFKTNTSAKKTAHIMCVGDLLCEAGMYNAANYDGQYNFHSCFRYIKDIFKQADWVIGNLETMICTEAPYTGETHKIDNKYHCNAPVEFLDALKYAGFDTFALSNNHNCDCGVNGILETLHHLDNCQFSHTGLFCFPKAERILLVDINGIKVALLSFSTWFNRNETRFTQKGRDEMLNIYSKDRLKQATDAARKKGAEFIITYMHWGIDAEYTHVESISQRALAMEVAECGVDYIVGSHTHSVQRYDILTTEDMRRVPVIYSIGNFATSEQADISRDTLILSIKLEKLNNRVQIVDEYYIPCHIFTYYKGESYPM